MAPAESLTDHSFRLCQELLRIDTTNPPGNERQAAELVATELTDAGLDPQILESAPQRANVVARLKGTGELPPLLLTAHLDVVEADPAHWTHPPFSGVVADGCLWGRGAIDMKNMAAMSVAIITKLARDKTKLKRDLIFAAVADEEAGCDLGSAWLCDNHPDLVRAEFAIGEGGGFNLSVAGATFFTVQVAEKGIAWLNARVRGEPGHGSMPRSDSAVIQLSEALARLGKARLPQHKTQVMADFVEGLAEKLPGPLRAMATKLLHPQVIPLLLRVMPDRSVARGLMAMLSNTASPTVLRAGNKINVIPGVAEAQIDGRTLPGQTTDDLIAELRDIMGPAVQFEVIKSLPPTVTDPVSSELYDTIVEVLGEREPGAGVVPYLLPGFTDAKSFTRLGARWYGFAPVKLPNDIRFAEMFHGHNERIPIDGLAWGTEVLYDVVTRFAE